MAVAHRTLRDRYDTLRKPAKLLSPSLGQGARAKAEAKLVSGAAFYMSLPVFNK